MQSIGNYIQYLIITYDGKESEKEYICVCPWRRKWQPPPVFLPGKSHGQRSLVGYSPWGCKRVGHDLATKQYMCIYIFKYIYESLCCTPETDTIL